MRNVNRLASIILALLVASWSAYALAEPPSHAPAHGWRKKHDPYYVGYTGKHWDRDYGILEGRCNREAVATVLGGVIGGAVGSRVADKEDRAVAVIVGTAVGALIGNKIGRKLDDADRSCIGHALEVGQPGQVVTWANPDTHVEYRMTLGERNDRFGDNCRAYSLTGSFADERSVRDGVACQAEPGAWKL